MGNGGDDGVFHGRLLGHPGTGHPTERATDVKLHAVASGEFDRPHRRLRAAGGGHLEQFVERDVIHLASLGHQARISGENTGDVGVELAGIRIERMGKGDGRGVGAASTEEGDIVIGRHALTATDDRNLAGRHCSGDAVRVDLENLGVAMRRVGQKSGLAPGERLALDTQVGERHRDERAGLAFTTGDEHVHFTAGLRRAHVVGKTEEFIGLFAHGRHDQHDLIAALHTTGGVVGDFADSVWGADGGPAELLHIERHGHTDYRRRSHRRPAEAQARSITGRRWRDSHERPPRKFPCS